MKNPLRTKTTSFPRKRESRKTLKAGLPRRFAPRNDILLIIVAAIFGMCALSGCKQQQPQPQTQTQQVQQPQTQQSPCPGGSNSTICPIPINND